MASELVQASCVNGHPASVWGLPEMVRRGEPLIWWGTQVRCRCGQPFAGR